MTGVRKADPGFRRQAIVVLVIGACVGALLIAGFAHYHIVVRGWLLAEPGASAQRARLIFLLLAALLLAPLLGFAAYVWSLGARVLRAREYPPPGLRVVRDTPVIAGARAVSRGRWLKALALGCGIAAVALAVLLWRFASLSVGHAP
jgi:hypothetical protein